MGFPVLYRLAGPVAPGARLAETCRRLDSRDGHGVPRAPSCCDVVPRTGGGRDGILAVLREPEL